MKKYSKILAFFFTIFVILTPFSNLQSQGINLNKSFDKNNIKPKGTVSNSALESFSEKLSSTLKANHPELYSTTKSEPLPNKFIISPNPLFPALNTSEVGEVFRGAKVYKSDNGTPRFVSSLKPQQKEVSKDKMLAKQIGLEFIQENKSFFQLEEPLQELKPIKESFDNEGNRHIVYQQYFEGLPVWGKELTIHLDKNNNVYLINSAYVPTPKNVLTSETISASSSMSIAISDLSKISKIVELSDNEKRLLNYYNPEAYKCIWIHPKTGEARLSWFIEIRPNIIHRWQYFIDAQTGEVLEKYNNSPSDGPKTATAQDLSNTSRTINTYQYQGAYYMWDVSRSMFRGTIPNADGMIITYTNNNGDYEKAWSPKPFSSSNNEWQDKASVSSHYYTGLIYEYYKNTHGRNSLDDAGMDMITVLHATQNGETIDNAWWNGKFVTLGDGGQTTTPWPGALDFVAHEFTHGVVTFTVDLVYKYQSGALNEGFADWGGAMVDRKNWLMGEDIAKKSFFPTGCVRDMQNPHNGGTKGDYIWLPAHMSEYYDLPLEQDNGGVHYNCGIINRATYLIGTAITREKLEKIYYRVLSRKYINKEAKFIDFRLACVKSAEELYGNNSAEVNAVKQAFDQVGITDGGGSKPNPDVPPVSGQEWIAGINSVDYSLWMFKPVINNPNTDIVQLTSTQAYTETNGIITVPDKGDFILFIDSENYVKYIKSNGTGEDYFSSTGEWASIDISPDGKYVAAISIYEEPKIYIFDIINKNYVAVELYIPNTGEKELYKTPLYPKSISWNVKSNMLIYDALNYSIDLQGNESTYWDVNIIDVTKGVILRVFPPLNSGEHVGDPSFSKNNEYIFAFDYYNQNTQEGKILAANLFSGDVGHILDVQYNQFSAGNPNYSVDGKYLSFQLYNKSDGKYYVYACQLDNSKINSTGEAKPIVSNVAIPKWFAIGSRPVGIEEQTVENKPLIFVSPNPCNSECYISFIPNGNSLLDVNIYNIKGMKVFSIIEKSQDLCSFVWKGSDDYGNSLPSGFYYLKLTYTNNRGQYTTETLPIMLLR